MKILIINGSPKGKYSITLQTCRFLEKKFPGHKFSEFPVAARIKSLEKDMTPALEAISQADAIIFSYPVYTFIAPYQLHRFISLLKATGVDLHGKFVSQITTSKHFFDVTAHRYIQDNCQDMGMKFVRGLSADMEDLLEHKGQKDAVDFFAYFLWCVKTDTYEPMTEPQPAPVHRPVTDVLSTENKTGDVVIVTSCKSNDQQLQAMIRRFQAVLPLRSRVVNLREYPFKGGCLGCFGCVVSGKCVYTDGFDNFLRNHLQTAQSIVYAFSIEDHSMGDIFKLYDDRQFCNGHRPVTEGMPVGYLVSGDYSRETNLQTIIEGRANVGGNFLAGVATDESDPDRAIDQLARSLVYALEKGYTPPGNFYGVGGMKIFRDLIWLMRGMMKADHRFYKKHGYYDFPQKKRAKVVKMYLVGTLFTNPGLKAKMGNTINKGMIMPYNHILEKS